MSEPDNTGTKDVVIPTADASDTRDYIALYAAACKEGDWSHPITDNEALIYEAQSEHYRQTDHTGYWHYKIERSQGRIVHPAKGHW